MENVNQENKFEEENKFEGDIRPYLKKIKTIDKLRSYVDELLTIPNEKLYSIWSLAKEFPVNDFENLKKSVHSLVNERYDTFMSIADNVCYKQYVSPELEHSMEHKIITYICSPKIMNELMYKYMPYDNFVRTFIATQPGFKFEEQFKEIPIEKGTVGMVRLIWPREGLYPEKTMNQAGIQTFCPNVFESIKSNVYMPWGPYEFTPFCNTMLLSELTLKEMIAEIEAFIKNQELIKCN